jgi:DNA-binding winged helix-turn-helix (wHTH) protein/SAM-dependent methyltransferase
MKSNWESSFFRGVALDAWRHITTPETTRMEADFLESKLRVNPGDRLLDVPCGNGRHCAELAQRGYAMTGVDQSEEFVSEARTATPASVLWVQDDMRSLSWVSEFNGAFCWGNSFCYLPWDEAQGFLETVARSLRPGAHFIVDTGMVAESLLPSLARNRWFRLGDILMLSENRYDPAESRLEIDYTFVRDGRIETRPSTSYLFTAGEICRMHRNAGLLPLELFGSTDSEPYQIGSSRLILVSKKHSEAPQHMARLADVAIGSGEEVRVRFQSIIQFGDFRFDPDSLILTHGSQYLELAPKALEVLAVLVKSAGNVVRTDELLSLVWPDAEVEEGNVAVYVCSLRRALAEHGKERMYIETVPKRGYRFTAPVQPVHRAGAPTVNKASAFTRVPADQVQRPAAEPYGRANVRLRL